MALDDFFCSTPEITSLVDDVIMEQKNSKCPNIGILNIVGLEILC